jgi:hypothetical protein
MAYRPHGRARVSTTKPEAFATCGRCGLLYNLVDLRWQFAWRGNELKNTQLLVCTVTCLDVPQEQLRVNYVVLQPDPVPVLNARPEPYLIDEQPSNRVTTSGGLRVATNYPRNSIRITAP